MLVNIKQRRRAIREEPYSVPITRSIDMIFARSTRSTKSDATKAAVRVAREGIDTSGAKGKSDSKATRVSYLSDSQGA